MITRLQRYLWNGITQWLNAEPDNVNAHLSDIERIRYEIRPADVVLVEGRSRLSNIIKTITLSSWTHSALYIGRLHDIEDAATRETILQHYNGDPNEPLLIEALLGHGTIVTPLSEYKKYHLRICRPTSLSRKDADTVVGHLGSRLGFAYDVRQIFDLARFMFPYGILPRRWRSSLFETNAGESTHTVCSSLIAEAFHLVYFPILPVMFNDGVGNVQFHNRNIKLFTPRDFDYSPYFEIIKYPMFGFDELAVYRSLPWRKHGASPDDLEDAEPEAHAQDAAGQSAPAAPQTTEAAESFDASNGASIADEGSPPQADNGAQVINLFGRLFNKPAAS